MLTINPPKEYKYTFFPPNLNSSHTSQREHTHRLEKVRYRTLFNAAVELNMFLYLRAGALCYIYHFYYLFLLSYSIGHCTNALFQEICYCWQITVSKLYLTDSRVQMKSRNFGILFNSIRKNHQINSLVFCATRWECRCSFKWLWRQSFFKSGCGTCKNCEIVVVNQKHNRNCVDCLAKAMRFETLWICHISRDIWLAGGLLQCSS